MSLSYSKKGEKPTRLSKTPSDMVEPDKTIQKSPKTTICTKIKDGLKNLKNKVSGGMNSYELRKNLDK